MDDLADHFFDLVDVHAVEALLVLHNLSLLGLAEPSDLNKVVQHRGTLLIRHLAALEPPANHLQILQFQRH